MTAWADVEPGTDPPVMAIGCRRAEYELAKLIPGCNIGSKDDIWRVPLSWPAWCALSCAFSRQPIEVMPALQSWADEAWAQVRQRYADRDAMECADPEIADALTVAEMGSGSDLRLTGPQRGAVQWLVKYRRAILADTRGNGKTPPLIRSLQVLGEAAFPALIICPGSSLLSWQRKLAAWAPGVRTVIIAGGKKQREQAIDALARGEADAGLIVWGNVTSHSRKVSYPGKTMPRCSAHGGDKSPATCQDHDREFQGFRLRTIIADECHRMADPESQQTRAVQYLMHHCENAWAVTGTLTPDHVGQLWPVLRGLDPRGFPARSRYLALYADQETSYGHRGVKVLGLRADNLSWFRHTVEPWFRRTPKQIARPGEWLAPVEFRYPQMAPKQAGQYKAIKESGLLELRDADIVTGTSIEQFTRMCQLSQAALEVEEGEGPDGFPVENVRMRLPSHKADDLLDFLDAEPGQWIVAATSPQLVALAEGKLHAAGISYSKIIGGMSYAAQDAAAIEFQEGQARVIFITAAGAESIDLQAAEGIVWMQPSPSFTVREQMTGRADRWGQDKVVRQVYMITPGTTDTRLYELGLDKGERHEQLTRDPEMVRWLMSAQPDEIPRDPDHDTDTASADRG